MIDPATGIEYNIYDLGFDRFLSKATPALSVGVDELPTPSAMISDFNETSGSNIAENSAPGKSITFKERAFQAIVDANGNGDFTEIQKAIDYVVLAGIRGGSILVLNGIYLLKSAIQITTSNIEIIGESANVLISPANGLDIVAFSISNYCKNIKLKNLSIDGNKSNGGKTAGIYLYQSSHISIEDVEISQCYYDGILFQETADVWVEGCAIDNCLRYGIAVGEGCSEVSVFNNELSYCQAGLWCIETSIQVSVFVGNNCHHNTIGIYGGSGIYISGNSCTYNTTGMQIKGSSKVYGNLCNWNTADGIDIIDYHATINGNEIYHNGEIGIYCQGTRGTRITDNFIALNGKGGVKLADLNTSAISNIISGNHFCYNSENAAYTYDDIYLAGASGKESSKNIISNNTFYYTFSGTRQPRYAINSINSSVDYLIITGNQVELSMYSSGGIHNLGSHDIKEHNQEV